VPKERFAADDWYDTWLPELAPSAALVKSALAVEDAAEWTAFEKEYRREMGAPAASLAVGCYCDDEARCHRSVLRDLLAEHGADLD
jgi:uncharacterized protein YeaO (DUF488 family)